VRVVSVLIPSCMGFNFGGGLAQKNYASQIKLGLCILLFFFGLDTFSDWSARVHFPNNNIRFVG